MKNVVLMAVLEASAALLGGRGVLFLRSCQRHV
jgi:hypothetical protein